MECPSARCTFQQNVFFPIKDDILLRCFCIIRSTQRAKIGKAKEQVELFYKRVRKTKDPKIAPLDICPLSLQRSTQSWLKVINNENILSPPSSSHSVVSAVHKNFSNFDFSPTKNSVAAFSSDIS